MPHHARPEDAISSIRRNAESFTRRQAAASKPSALPMVCGEDILPSHRGQDARDTTIARLRLTMPPGRLRHAFKDSIVAIIIAAVFLATGLDTRAKASAVAPSVRAADLLVMSFNIRYGTANDGENSWPNRRGMVCDVLRRYEPDVVGLQEALRFQIDGIRAALPRYAEIGVGRDDGATEGEYSAILYRKDRLEVTESGTFWLSDTPEVCGSITWGNACTRVCTWGRFVPRDGGQAFYLFNTHLDHISQYSRDRSVILLAQRIRDRAHADPVLVTGDLNAGENNPAVRYLKGRRRLGAAKNGLARNPVRLVDTFRALHPEADDVGTFNGFKGNSSGDKIDYIFAQPGIEVLQATILRDNGGDRYPSDHFPVLAALCLTAERTYHVDSEGGDDRNAGTSADKAWKTLEPVNAHRFEPGDRILLKAGTVYTGPFKPMGSGQPGRPIIVDRYGQGDKPRIEGRGIQDAILIENLEYWEINNLEVTNLGATRADRRTGVRISASRGGTLRHIHLRDLHVRDVNGSNQKSREGCGIFFECRGRTPSRFDDLVIEDCRLERTDRNGICGRSAFTDRSKDWFPSTNVAIRGNRLEDIGGDCIKPWGCDGCLVEYNVVHGGRRRAEDYAAGIWPWSCDNTVIQFNEVSGMKGTKDGQGFDSDYNCRNSLFQYNYSHDNDGGFMLICTPATSPRNIGCVGTVIRYNISRNDGARLFQISGPVSDTQIYNNVFFVPQERDIHAVLWKDWNGWARNTAFYNNIFYVEGTVRYEFGQSTGNVFENNAFFGRHESRPDDPHAATADPMLVAAGSGGDGRESLAGYKLKEGSPCFGAGRMVENAGPHDFWETALPTEGRPNIGADATHTAR